MGAPKGNKNAQRGTLARNRGIHFRLSDAALETLQIVAANEHKKISEILELALLAKYPEEFDGKF